MKKYHNFNVIYVSLIIFNPFKSYFMKIILSKYYTNVFDFIYKII